MFGRLAGGNEVKGSKRTGGGGDGDHLLWDHHHSYAQYIYLRRFLDVLYSDSMSSSSTPRQADFPMSKGPGAQVSRRTLTRSSSDGSDELHGAIAQLSLSPSSLAQHETVNSSSHQDDIDVESANSAPSPPQSPYLAGSDTSYDFDRPSEDGRSGGLSSLSPQPSLYSLTDSLRAQIMRQEFGRSINSTNTIYKFAADEDEAKRLGTPLNIFRKTCIKSRLRSQMNAIKYSDP